MRAIGAQLLDFLHMCLFPSSLPHFQNSGWGTFVKINLARAYATFAEHRKQLTDKNQFLNLCTIMHLWNKN